MINTMLVALIIMLAVIIVMKHNDHLNWGYHNREKYLYRQHFGDRHFG